MKRLFTILFFLSTLAMAANVQVLKPSGAEFSPDAPEMVHSIIRASVSQTGNVPVDGSAEIQIRTNLMTMGNSFIVICEQLQNDVVIKSSKQKALSLDELDVAIEKAVTEVFKNEDEANNSNTYSPIPSAVSGPEYVYVVPTESSEPVKDPNDNFAHKRPTRNYISYGLGIAFWHNYKYIDESCSDEYLNYSDCLELSEPRSWDQAFMFHHARIFETSPRGAITIVSNTNLTISDDWELQEVFLIGGRFFFTTSSVSPFLGAGIGLGLQFDSHYYDSDQNFAIGIAGEVNTGVVFFRNSSVQLELGVAWDAMWAGFESFDNRFGAIGIYAGVNY